MTEAGELVGIVSETDLVRKTDGVARHGEARSNWLFGTDEREALLREGRTAAEVMSHPVITVEASRPVAEAARLMVKCSLNRLPVVSGGRLVGIVSRADLVRTFARPDAEVAEEIRDGVLLKTLWIDPRSVEVTVAGGEVTLAGTLETKTTAELVPAFVASVPGVVAVDASRLGWRYDDLARRGFRIGR